MSKALLEKVFEKAGKESGKGSLYGKAEYLSEKLLEDYRFQVSGKSLTRYYRKEFPPKKEVQDHLARYLGFSDYQNFCISQGPASEKRFPKRKLASRKLLLRFLIFPVIGVSGYVGYEAAEEDCMIWSTDRFEQVPCTGNSEERVLNRFELEDFRKVSLSDSTVFFKDGEPKLWYHKNGDQLELFSAPGLHPENGKTLRPITRYMIDKYLDR